MTPRIVVAVLSVLLFSALSLRAQSQNCSTINATLSQVTTTRSPDGTILSETHTYAVTCINTNTNTTYFSASNSVTGTGAEGENASNTGLVHCIPTFTTTSYVAANTSYQNFFSNIANNNSYFAPTHSCSSSGTTTTTTYCNAVACSSGSGGGHQPCPGSSPIVLDTTGQGFDLTGAADGVKFDIAGDGVMKQMGWTSGDSQNAFLALPAADGLVHNGKQLFGNFSPQPPSNDPNGFLALAVYDQPQYGGNGDGVIDTKDAVFNSLRLWIDSNHDGICQPNELHTLPSLGVYSISLRYSKSGLTDQYGNVFRYRATVNPNDPKASHIDRKAFDIFFVTVSPSARNKKRQGVRLLMVRLSQSPNPC